MTTTNETKQVRVCTINGERGEYTGFSEITKKHHFSLYNGCTLQVDNFDGVKFDSDNVNTYAKYCPNVFVAKCPEKHERGEVITLTTQYGKEHECIVYNLQFEKDGFFYYSIVRADGFNAQERAKAKAERYNQWAASAEKKSDQYYKTSHAITNNIPMGQPILVGHHSEGRHRRDLDRSWNAMGKSVEMSKKAESHESKAEYWERKAKDINLSMPESIEFFEYKLEQAKQRHEGLKNGTIPRAHSFSLTYAKKEVNELEKNLQTAKKLWL